VSGRRLRRAALLAALAAAPALAYLLPSSGVLKRLAQRRGELALSSLEARGTFSMGGEGARAAAAATGLPLTGSELSLPAILSLKMPGRCRLELTPPDLAEADRPAAVVREGKITGLKGLERVAAAQALLRGVCALLSERPGGPEPDRVYAEVLSRLGIGLGDVFLGRFGGRIAYVLGARPSEKKPQVWVDKQTFQPVRIVASFAGALVDVQLLDYGAPTGGDWFPRAVEVHEGGELRARFVTEKVVPNPRIPDAVF
jgi:hypothetical protein